MANTYFLRYFKEIHPDDHTVYRLEFHQKLEIKPDVPVIPIAEPVLGQEIGAVVQSLHLQIQGQQADIDSPIVKTSLAMSFVDAPEIVDDRKNGMWEEFYSADATGWKVLLLEDNNMIWGGYITPDSFSEELSYRGVVSIIARDNIGHLKDFPFDAQTADGTISLYDLVTMGWEKIQSPMVLDWSGDGDGVNWLNCSGQIMYATRMNISAFEDMSWYDAIEKALYSYGLVMRYIERNRVHICPLRDMPKHGYHDYDYFGANIPIFATGARRELVPAAKMIQENVSYDLEDKVSFPQIEQSRYTGVETSYRCKIEGAVIDGTSFGRVEHDAPIWAISELPYYTGWDNYTDYSLCFDISRYGTGYFTERQGGDAEMRKYMYIAANNVDARSIMFRKFITPCEFAIKIKFGRPLSINSANKLEQQSVYNLEKIIFRIEVKQGGNTYYYAGNGEWKVDEHTMTYEYDPQDGVTDFEVQVKPNVTMVENADSQTKMTLHIYKVVYKQMGSGSLQHIGLYACIQDFAIAASDTASLMKKNNVKTVYNEDNNIVIKRDPEIAPTFDAVPFPGLIKNGIFVENLGMLQPTPEWQYGNEQALQLAVHVHKQLLCYHSKPNNLITGTIVAANSDANVGSRPFSSNWMYRGKEHMLISGNLNLLTNRVEGAVLREFIRYEDMWKESEVEPPLYFENISEGEMAIGFSTNNIQYSMDGKSWEILSAGGTTPSVGKGGKIYFKASGLTPTSSVGIGAFSSTADCKVGGNAMSMLYGDAYADKVVISESYTFNRLFLNLTKLKDASELILPATTLSPYCYNAMFRGCSSLVNAPELPATTLSPYCYNGMFLGCSSLVNAPELPATTLVTYCYNAMFLDCKKLAYIKALFVTEPSASYTNTWLSNVAQSGTFVKNIMATWEVRGVNAVPSDWTIEYVNNTRLSGEEGTVEIGTNAQV